MQIIAAAVAGLVFGVGLTVAGMVNPEKVLNFLDISGAWDPSLVLVMGGGATVAAAGYAWLRQQSRPALAPAFQWPTARRIDRPLVVGSALFGIGWGLAGLCPGPAIAVLTLAPREALPFVVAMAAGMALRARSHRIQRD
jgi:uncharacterized membrane protein YedE/YeeE